MSKYTIIIWIILHVHLSTYHMQYKYTEENMIKF